MISLAKNKYSTPFELSEAKETFVSSFSVNIPFLINWRERELKKFRYKSFQQQLSKLCSHIRFHQLWSIQFKHKIAEKIEKSFPPLLFAESASNLFVLLIEFFIIKTTIAHSSTTMFVESKRGSTATRKARNPSNNCVKQTERQALILMNDSFCDNDCYWYNKTFNFEAERVVLKTWRWKGSQKQIQREFNFPVCRKIKNNKLHCQTVKTYWKL